MRIVNAKKSKYYDAALSNFEGAERCFERAGLVIEWEKTGNRPVKYRSTDGTGSFGTGHWWTTTPCRES